ncbi:Serine/threonine-protein kinase PRR1 [Fulvia fulva]|uniref:non-specific serine/threonine protein kinase n=1 Tax=Passalora fulva TaxID=5499 RepID=A0A9Q8P8R7_PASFU|nr:Serine/threonine-protein kinase PRR1 [Fulvia fulva]KAK4624088.1 Serine/threonine-protein kinase PRR1 [Fulvia fulva]KAK4626001.1 Serine/threonine-protein kinase PRR1 [Fulvia fulva]UJO17398.1 Serine/threonine-protein kinase PRR1 [Fulvia fulva]WPV15461.1 Serine/threonine-protein kinase PRR1 [Fulvia fulva]WPV30205.1 Serine/threonine-protein kinase PRR1 [Fulvia fulva]
MSAAPRAQPEATPTPTPTQSHQQRAAAELHGLTGLGSAAVLPPLDTATAATLTHRSTHHASPANAGLSLKTDLHSAATRPTETPTIMYESSAAEPTISPTLPTMGSSLRSNLSTSSLTSSLSPGSASALPSPYLAAMSDLTPLPSPLVGSDAPLVWRKRSVKTPNRSRDNSLHDPSQASNSGLPISPDSPSRRKKYGSLMQEAAIANASREAGGQEVAKSSAHTRNRSVSDFKPEQLHNVRQRHVTFGSGDAPNIEGTEYHMQREAYLAAQRGIAETHLDGTKQLPTPPPSNSSMHELEQAEEEQPYLEDGTASELLEIHCGINNKRRKFRQLRQLGQGTFSTVMLATREKIPAHPTPEIEDHLDPHKLVAVKIVLHGPAGGANRERIETSLKREVEMLKSVSHPSLIHLKACEYQERRSLLILTYCPGGDLFEFASQKRDLLTSNLIQRMFAELVSATRYLHTNWIVHRDIKLENVLVNLSEPALRSLDNPLTHPTPLVTLTDLGLSRKLPDPPDPPLLSTRCGSEDYAAPEILLGQQYDGRLTDGWALGVLLYALMEGRLPFDAPPGKPDRSRNTHRIARCDWIWCRFGDEDGEWDETRPGSDEFAGAQPAVEALLKKVRMGRKSLDDVAQLPWVQEGIQVPGGLRMREEDDDSDLL